MCQFSTAAEEKPTSDPPISKICWRLVAELIKNSMFVRNLPQFYYHISRLRMRSMSPAKIDAAPFLAAIRNSGRQWNKHSARTNGKQDGPRINASSRWDVLTSLQALSVAMFTGHGSWTSPTKAECLLWRWAKLGEQDSEMLRSLLKAANSLSVLLE